MLTGRCFCGAISYAAAAPYHRTLCHCSMCRRSAGAPCVAWFSLARADFRLLQGVPKRFRSSAWATRTFCPDCGTPLTFEADATPDELDVTTCSLDDPARLPPQDHTFVEAQLPWLLLADGLSRHARTRDDY